MGSRTNGSRIILPRQSEHLDVYPEKKASQSSHLVIRVPPRRQLLQMSPKPLKFWQQLWQILLDAQLEDEEVQPIATDSRDDVRDETVGALVMQQSSQTLEKPEKKQSHSSHLRTRAPCKRQVLHTTP